MSGLPLQFNTHCEDAANGVNSCGMNVSWAERRLHIYIYIYIYQAHS